MTVPRDVFPMTGVGISVAGSFAYRNSLRMWMVLLGMIAIPQAFVLELGRENCFAAVEYITPMRMLLRI